MEEKIQMSLRSGVISLVVALVATYAVSLAIPTTGLEWALIAVGIASFLSGSLSTYNTFE